MGCNMYVHVEQCTANGNWRYVPGEVYEDAARNPALFGRLAGVRNDEGFKPLVQRYGLPPDVSDRIRTLKERSALSLPDDRVTSYLTLAELESEDWVAFSDQWHETDFSLHVMNRLRRLAADHPNDLRIVFWFDDIYADLY